MLLDHLTDVSLAAKPMATSQFMASNMPMASTNEQQQPDQYFAGAHHALATETQLPRVQTNLLTPTASIPPTPGSLAGRKRSRGDIFEDDDDDVELQQDRSLPTPEEDSFINAISDSRSNLSLVHPHEHSNVGQNGSSMDVDIAQRAIQPQHSSRPSVSSRKSQRIDTSTPDDNDLAQLVLPHEMREATTQPLIDEATRTLGISWTRMDSSEALLINQAAYSKFIQNHFPSLKDVSVWFENSALPAYLVSASNAFTNEPEFYLFSHDLLEGRLVTRNAADLLPRLQLLPAIELAAPGGHIRAEMDSATASQNEVNNVLEASANETESLQTSKLEDVAPRGRSADPAYRYRELLCTAHEMEMD